jgi:hypothetical protein
MTGRKQAATSAPPISTLDPDGYARSPDAADSIHVTDLTAAMRTRSSVGAHDVAELGPDRGEAIRATVAQSAVRDRHR